MLRDRIAFGIRDNNLRRNFIQADPDKLSLANIIQECKTYELTNQRFQEVSIKKISQKSSKKTCKFCGKKHEFKIGVCPAIGATCSYCKGKNHYESVCKRKKSKRRIREVQENSSETDSSDSELFDFDDENVKIVSKVQEISKLHRKIMSPVKVHVNGKWKSIDCEIDTGSSVCLVGLKNLKSLTNGKKQLFRKSQMVLKTITGQIIKTLGEVKLRCTTKKKQFDVVFQVVDFDHDPLLSANASHKLDLVKFPH